MEYIIALVVVIAALIAGTVINQKRKEAIENGSVQPPEPLAASTPVSVVPPSSSDSRNQNHLYEVAAAALGRRMKQDPGVPNLYACASSLSGVLIAAGISGFPVHGIAGTAELNEWLEESQDFIRVVQPQPGDIVMSPTPKTPQQDQLDHGHCGVMAKVNQGILSNDSDTGEWRERWTLPAWLDYYGTYGRLPTVYYRWITR